MLCVLLKCSECTNDQHSIWSLRPHFPQKFHTSYIHSQLPLIQQELFEKALFGFSPERNQINWYFAISPVSWKLGLIGAEHATLIYSKLAFWATRVLSNRPKLSQTRYTPSNYQTIKTLHYNYGAILVFVLPILPHISHSVMTSISSPISIWNTLLSIKFAQLFHFF